MEHGLGAFGRADLHPGCNPLYRQGGSTPQPGSDGQLARVAAPASGQIGLLPAPLRKLLGKDALGPLLGGLPVQLPGVVLAQFPLHQFQHLLQQQTPRPKGVKLSLPAQTLASLETAEKDHGRLEIRRYYQSDHVDWFADRRKWEGLKSFGMVESIREVDGKATTERRYYLSSLPLDIATFARAVRSHWGVENKVHWIMDVCFREDQSRARAGFAAENLATLRRLALNLLKREKIKTRGSFDSQPQAQPVLTRIMTRSPQNHPAFFNELDTNACQRNPSLFHRTPRARIQWDNREKPRRKTDCPPAPFVHLRGYPPFPWYALYYGLIT